MAEFKFSVYVYPLDAAAAEALRARLEEVVLVEVEAAGLFMGPVEVEDGQEGSGAAGLQDD